MESGEVSLNDLEIKLTLQKDPKHYHHNKLQRIVGTELSATQGEAIRYFKSDVVIRGGTSNPLVSLGGFITLWLICFLKKVVVYIG